ncbi:cyclin-F-like [Tubulanus polymorphus]|uniref:cyclin-F-like n=1 Tax=Tubulanus polymorphus TaxID=672921 RepID=UPI003DA34DEA
MKVIAANVKCRLTNAGSSYRKSLTGPPTPAASTPECGSPAARLTCIWNLPEELVVQLLKSLPIKDLLNMRQVHRGFRDLIDNNSILYQTVCFYDQWPSSTNIKHFELAAKHNNLQALIKLGVAYLYNEGLPSDVEGKQIFANGIQAARLFCHAESLTANIDAFTWLFIRPPWSNTGACCKECVFKNMVNYVHETNDAGVAMCVSKTLSLFADEDSFKRMNSYLLRAANQRSQSALFTIWKNKYHKKVLDRGAELMIMRELRDIAAMGYTPAQLALCRNYVCGNYAGIPRNQAVSTVKNFIQSSTATRINSCYKLNKDLTHSMRYILVDWLVEVASMKKFSTRTLHVAINVVDRFLNVHDLSRDKLQLLGVSAMVVCSRYLGKDIITIREAAWLTDNTYKYEDVVRMMGEVVATLKGKIQVLTVYDYLELFENLLSDSFTDRCRYLAEYISELIMLHCQLGCYKQSQLAAGAILLTNIFNKTECFWSNKLREFSGYSINDLVKCVIHIHDKCFVSSKMLDHRSVELKAVKQRYSDLSLNCVSEIQPLQTDDLCNLLTTHNYMSPSNISEGHVSVTPQVSSSGVSKVSCGSVSSKVSGRESSVSGYDADYEDESCSIMEYEDEDPLVDIREKHDSPTETHAKARENATFHNIHHSSFDRSQTDQSAASSSIQIDQSPVSPRQTNQSYLNIHRQLSRSITAPPTSSCVTTPVSMETSRASINWSPHPAVDDADERDILNELSTVAFSPARRDNTASSLGDISGRHNIPAMRLAEESQRTTHHQTQSVKRKCSVSFDESSNCP